MLTEQAAEVDGMNVQEAMAQLESFGTEQNRKVYRRHGVLGSQYGVSYANLKALAKRIKRDHQLASELWATGNHDARVLATMIADPSALTKRAMDAWAKSIDNYVLADAFAALVAQSEHARDKADQWITASDDFMGQAGWNVVARLSSQPDLPDDYFKDLLKVVEKEIHSSKNRTRHAMNGALIAIGLRNSALEKLAIAAAKRIGAVEVDHGETDCKTPDAVRYIEKARDRKQRRSSR